MEVEIRPLQEEDAYTSVRWRNDPEVFRYTGNTYDHVISIEEELCWIRRAIANRDEYRCAILADGKYVGNIYLTGIDGREAVYGIFIGEKSYWGKGVAHQATKLLIDYAFSRLGLDRVWLKVKVMNTRAYQFYLNFGFKEVGHDDVYVTMEIYNIRKC